ncbi:hypothetical protein GCM10022206_90330 [Streptomyces chiangmaiensis]
MLHARTAAIETARRQIGRAALRAVDYLRVSTEEQVKGYGIAYSGKKTSRYIAQKDWEHVGTYKTKASPVRWRHTSATTSTGSWKMPAGPRVPSTWSW